MATETERKFGDLTAAEVRSMEKQALIGGTTRSLDLLKRMPTLFKARGWVRAEPAIDIAILAVACFKIGARGTRLKVPAGLAILGEKWTALSDPSRAAPPTCHEIVDALELRSMLEAP